MKTKKVVLCSAPHGGRYARIDEKTKKLLRDVEYDSNLSFFETNFSRFMPTSPTETLKQMQALYRNGVRVFHDHAYDRDGIHAATLSFYEEVDAGLRNIDPNVIHSVASSNRRGELIVVLYNIINRLLAMNVDPFDFDPKDPKIVQVFIDENLDRFKGTFSKSTPDTITTITNLEYSVDNTIDPSTTRQREIAFLYSATHPAVIQGYYEKHITNLSKTSIHHEIEISNIQSFQIILKHFENRITSPVHFVILFNFTDDFKFNKTNVNAILNNIKAFKKRNPNHHVILTFGLVILPHLAKKVKRTAGQTLTQDSAGNYLELDYRELVELTLKLDTDHLVDCFRFGTEDTTVMYGKQTSDEQLVQEMHEILRDNKLEIERNTDYIRNELFKFPARTEAKSQVITDPEIYKDPDVNTKYSWLIENGFELLVKETYNPYYTINTKSFDTYVKKTEKALLAMQKKNLLTRKQEGTATLN